MLSLPRPTSLPRHLRHALPSSTRPASNRATALPAPVLDLQKVIAHPDQTKQNLIDRNFPLPPGHVDRLLALHAQAGQLRRALQEVRERRNAVSGGAGQTAEEKRAAGREIKAELKRLEPELGAVEREMAGLAFQLPNASHPDAPVGGEDQAKTVNTFGPDVPPSVQTANPQLDHVTTTSPGQLGWTDFPSAALVSGTSWPILQREGALLELALTNYALSVALAHDFTPVLPPDVVRADVALRCGFAPRDGNAQQTYFLSDGTPAGNAGGDAGLSLCLAGTAEVPLVAMSGGEVFREAELPRRSVGLGRAFRAEAGARGADSRGLYRVHQFSKVEMVVVCTPETSNEVLEELRSIQEEILSGLGLSLRVLDMPTQELGASAHRKYDIEAWMPGRGTWGELSSASNCTDFQARRLGIRYRPADAAAKTAYAHTLNATAAAIPRLIVVLLENGVVLDDKGEAVRVRLPGVLKKFWLGKESGVVEWVAEGEPLRTP